MTLWPTLPVLAPAAALAALVSSPLLAASRTDQAAEPSSSLRGPRGVGFTTTIIDPAMAGDCKMAGDIDGDGLIDAVIGGHRGEDLRWYRWPDWRMTRIGLASVEFTTDGALGDVDGDGDLDVVIPDGQTGNNLVWFRNPLPSGDPLDGAQWQRRVIGELGSWCKDIELADFNGDGLLDVAARADYAAFIFFQDAGGAWTRILLQGGLTGEGMASGDIDGDGDTDVVIRGDWYENPRPSADPRTAPWPAHAIASGLSSELKILVADINGAAGAEVLYSYSESTGPVRWYTPAAGDPRGSWIGHEVVSAIAGCHTLQAGDIDLDGDTDLLLAQMHTTADRRIFVMLNADGAAGAWTSEDVDNTGLHSGVLADFGGDGDLDIYGANWTGNPPLRLYESTLAGGCTADTDGSGVVNSSDISAFLGVWLVSVQEGGLDGDFDGSGLVNSSDISAFMLAWLRAVQDGC